MLNNFEDFENQLLPSSDASKQSTLHPASCMLQRERLAASLCILSLKFHLT